MRDIDELVLMTFNGIKTAVNIDKPVKSIEITIMSGDEVASVIYEDGTQDIYDSATMCGNYRIVDYFDDEYTLYSVPDGIDLIDKFDKRKATYWNYYSTYWKH